MRHYEVVFMVHPDQSEQVPAMIDRYKQMVEGRSGKMHRIEDWGRLQLTYPIQKIAKAHYVLGLSYAKDDAKKAVAREHLQTFLRLAPTDSDAETAKQMLDYLK